MTRGGKRKGAGRPPIAERKRRVRISTTIRPETLAKIQQWARAGDTAIGGIIDAMVAVCRVEQKE